MPIKAIRDTESITVAHSDPRTEAALAMAKINRRWSLSRSVESLQRDLARIIETAQKDPSLKPGELEGLRQKMREIALLEELAQSFKAVEEEPDELLPRFEGSADEARATLESYARSVGVRIEFIR